VERAALEQLEGKISEEIAKRFGAEPPKRVTLLQYRDDPQVEPGQLVLRIIIDAPEGKKERERVLDAFHDNREAFEGFREDLVSRLPEISRLEIMTSTGTEGSDHGPQIRLMLRPQRPLEERATGGGELTPVMARLGPADLETLDTLITAGIAPNRAEAVRWALARIRERPAYSQLRDRAREIEELKAQF
jgi:hypothetical protein